VKNAQEVVEKDLDYICEMGAGELEKLEGSHVLITGGAGFLGYYLVQGIFHWNKRAGRAPIRVSLYDSFIRDRPAWLDQLQAQVGPTLEVRKHDIRDPMPSDAPAFDYIVHAASIASPTYYRKHPLETMEANVNGLVRLLDHARNTQGKRLSGFLFFSTSEIYGDPSPDAIPTDETYRGFVSCTGPRACYDESKRYGETLCVTYASKYELPVRTARPFNNYGPGLKLGDGRVIPDFAQDVLAGRDIVMRSDGSPSRTFCYITDATVGYLKVLVRGRNGEAYNIGVERPEVTVGQLAEHIARISRELFGSGSKVIHQPSSESAYLTDNPQRRCPNIDKARRELEYKPTIELEDGLRRTLTWYRGQS
jgi:UDP-glucuronate decarboxylase